MFLRQEGLRYGNICFQGFLCAIRFTKRGITLHTCPNARWRAASPPWRAAPRGSSVQQKNPARTCWHFPSVARSSLWTPARPKSHTPSPLRQPGRARALARPQEAGRPTASSDPDLHGVWGTENSTRPGGARPKAGLPPRPPPTAPLPQLKWNLATAPRLQWADGSLAPRLHPSQRQHPAPPEITGALSSRRLHGLWELPAREDCRLAGPGPVTCRQTSVPMSRRSDWLQLQKILSKGERGRPG